MDYYDVLEQYYKNNQYDKIINFFKKNKKDLNNKKNIKLYALTLEKVKLFSESIFFLKKLLNYQDDFDVNEKIASLYLIQNNYEESLKYYNCALLFDDKDSNLHNKLGFVFCKLGNEKLGVKHFNKSFDLDNNFLAPIYNLLEIYEKSNNEKEFRNLLFSVKNKFKDDHVIKFFHAKYYQNNKDINKTIKILNEIEYKKLNVNWQTRFLFLKGSVLDKTKNYNEAFKSYKKANDIILSNIGKKHVDENKFIIKLNNYINNTKDLNIVSKKNKDDEIYDKKYKIYFLMGFPRSGTTLIDTILLSHENIQICEEKPMVQIMIKELEKKNINNFININESFRKKLKKIYYKELDKVIDKNNKKTKIIIDKNPFHIIDALFIKNIFPAAKFILCIRHPLDCILSGYMQRFELNTAMMNFLKLDSASKMYDLTFTLWKQYEKHLNNSVYKIKYEDLVKNFEAETKKLTNFLEINWDKKMLDFSMFAKQRGRITTPSYSQVIQPIYHSSIEKWKSYKKNLKDINQKMDKWINFHGYK